MSATTFTPAGRLADPFGELFAACASGLANAADTPLSADHRQEALGNVRTLKLASLEALGTIGTMLSLSDGACAAGAGDAVVHLVELVTALDELEREGRRTV